MVTTAMPKPQLPNESKKISDPALVTPIVGLHDQRQRTEPLQHSSVPSCCEGNIGPSPPIRYSRINV